MRLFIQHRTTYRYTVPARYSLQLLHLTPQNDASQQVIAWHLNTPGRPMPQTDLHGNLMHSLSLTHPHQEIVLQVDGEVETCDQPVLLAPHAGSSPLLFLAASSLASTDARLTDFARTAAGKHQGQALAEHLMRAINDAVQYVSGSTEVSHTAAEALAQGRGVCQDQAHVFIAACRVLGVPARYVSGYLLTDASHVASHAWADLWLADQQAWWSVDITHACPAVSHYCRLAVGRDYLDAAPVRGMRRGGHGETMSVEVSVAGSREEIIAAQQ